MRRVRQSSISISIAFIIWYVVAVVRWSGVDGFFPSPQGYTTNTKKSLGLFSKLSKTTSTSTSTTESTTRSTKTSSYQDTDAASQGLVSSLTDLVNTFLGNPNYTQQQQQQQQQQRQEDPMFLPSNPPQTVDELKTRIRDDYIQNNYLWTGNLDLDCFDPTCRFTDPTLSFQGTDTFQKNTQNLVPLVERFVTNYESILLNISATPDYIETRWNMVGELNIVFWKPKIDVIGQTKFWFRRHPDNSFLQVYDYDEKWEIPAYQALLQLVTPAGTFPNTVNR